MYHRELSSMHDPLPVSIEKNISDDDIPFNVKVTLLNKKGDIDIEHKASTVHLHCAKQCINGLFLYTYTYDHTNSFEMHIGKEIPCAIYHIVKRFYHDHESHHEEEDSLISAFHQSIGAKDIDINATILKATDYYLELFQEKFEAYADWIEEAYAQFANFLDHRKKTQYIAKIFPIHKALSKLYEDPLGEWIYCRAFVNSVDESILDGKHRAAIKNATNSIRKIRIYRDKTTARFTETTSQISYASGRLSFGLGIISGILGFVSITIAVGALIFSIRVAGKPPVGIQTRAETQHVDSIRHVQHRSVLEKMESFDNCMQELQRKNNSDHSVLTSKVNNIEKKIEKNSKTTQAKIPTAKKKTTK